MGRQTTHEENEMEAKEEENINIRGFFRINSWKPITASAWLQWYFSGFIEENHLFLVMSSQLKTFIGLHVEVHCSVPKIRKVDSSERFVE